MCTPAKSLSRRSATCFNWATHCVYCTQDVPRNKNNGNTLVRSCVLGVWIGHRQNEMLLQFQKPGTGCDWWQACLASISIWAYKPIFSGRRNALKYFIHWKRDEGKMWTAACCSKRRKRKNQRVFIFGSGIHLRFEYSCSTGLAPVLRIVHRFMTSHPVVGQLVMPARIKEVGGA